MDFLRILFIMNLIQKNQTVNIFWIIIIVGSFLYSIYNGKFNLLTNTIYNIPNAFIQLFLTISFSIILWMGIINIAKDSGFIKLIQKILMPFIKILFKTKNNIAIEMMCTNIASNLFGLGNAATPAGISACKELDKESGVSASDDLILFLVLNTSSIQIIPNTIIMLRQSYSARNPSAIIGGVIFVSFFSTLLGIILCKLFEKIWRNKI